MENIILLTGWREPLVYIHAYAHQQFLIDVYTFLDDIPVIWQFFNLRFRNSSKKIIALVN